MFLLALYDCRKYFCSWCSLLFVGVLKFLMLIEGFKEQDEGKGRVGREARQDRMQGYYRYDSQKLSI